MDINQYKQHDLLKKSDITYISNYTTKIYLHKTKFIIPNSVTCIDYRCVLSLNSIYPNSIKYLLNYTDNNYVDDDYINVNYTNNNYTRKNIIICSTKFICIKNLVCDKLDFYRINKNLIKYNILNNIFIQNLCVQNNATNKTKIQNVFLLENITSIMIGVYDHCTMKNMYSFKNIKYVTLIDSLCLSNIFLFKNIKILRIVYDISVMYLSKLCALNVCILILFNFSHFTKINLTNISYFKNLKTFKFHENLIDKNNLTYINTIFIKNVQNIIVMHNQHMSNTNTLKNTRVLIIFVYSMAMNFERNQNYYNFIGNFKFNFVDILKHNVSGYGTDLISKNTNKYFGEEYYKIF